MEHVAEHEIDTLNYIPHFLLYGNLVKILLSHTVAIFIITASSFDEKGVKEARIQVIGI